MQAKSLSNGMPGRLENKDIVWNKYWDVIILKKFRYCFLWLIINDQKAIAGASGMAHSTADKEKLQRNKSILSIKQSSVERRCFGAQEKALPLNVVKIK